jgi:molybdopterin/thiamine biosynthesis adenylyltransferase
LKDEGRHMLTKNDLTRYKRQILYTGFGEKGQKRLKQSHVVVAGLGGLGCSAALHLACAGIGHITEHNAREIIKGADLVIDGTDNFKTRFILNKACVAEGIPFIHGGVQGLFGEVTTIIPGKTPCLACIFPEVPQRRSTIPVFGVTPALIAILQVIEAIKLLAGFGSLLTGKMLYFNGETMDFTFCNLVKNPNCQVCGTKKV